MVLKLRVFIDDEFNNVPDVYVVLLIWWYYYWISFNIHGIFINKVNLGRRIIMSKSLSDAELIKLYERNIKELQGQLKNSYKRIKFISYENYNLRRKANIESDFGYDLTQGDGWAEEPVENPDAKHIGEDNDFKTGG